MLPTLALGLDGDAEDPRAAAFCDHMEAAVAAALAAAPPPMFIPLARFAVAEGDD